MTELLAWFLLSVLAIDNLTNILTTVDLLEWPRIKFQLMFPRLGKLATCHYCQAFWLSGPAAYFLLYGPAEFKIIVLWLALHRLVQLSTEFHERYLGRAPQSLFITTRSETKESNQLAL